jgi:hypothetical protein
MRAILWARTIYRVLDIVRIEAKFRNRMRHKKHENLSNNKSKIISIKIVNKKILNQLFLARLASYSQPGFDTNLSHPFKNQVECILLCVPRDQSHIS